MTAHPATSQHTAAPTFDVASLRRQFPILQRTVHGKPLVYLDSAATSHKPQPVIDAVSDFYQRSNSNVHRGVHQLSVEATEAYERSRERIGRLIHAASRKEVIFTRGATEAINLVAQTYGRANLKPGDEVLITWMEHHSNIVPWQMICEQTGATLKVAPINDAGELLLDEFEKLITERTKIVAVVHISNTLGTINPITKISEMAHRAGAVVVVDGAQGLQHTAVDVCALGCDFYAGSGHKMFGPTGIGFLWGREELLKAMPPYQGGGDMIRSVTFEKTTYNDLPNKYEAGTPNIAGAIGLGAAVEFIDGLDREALAAHEQNLLEYATAALSTMKEVRLIGTAAKKSSIVSFVIDGIHPHDIGTVLDHEGVAVRTGHHCTQPLMDRYNVPATARASLALYNTRDDVDALLRGLRTAIEVFGA